MYQLGRAPTGQKPPQGWESPANLPSGQDRAQWMPICPYSPLIQGEKDVNDVKIKLLEMPDPVQPIAGCKASITVAILHSSTLFLHTFNTGKHFLKLAGSSQHWNARSDCSCPETRKQGVTGAMAQSSPGELQYHIATHCRSTTGLSLPRLVLGSQEHNIGWKQVPWVYPCRAGAGLVVSVGQGAGAEGAAPLCQGKGWGWES